MFAVTEGLMLVAMFSPVIALFLGACYAIDRFNARPVRRSKRR